MTLSPGAQEWRLRRTLEALWTDIGVESPTTAAGALSSAELLLPTPDGPLRLALDAHGLRHLLVPRRAGSAEVEDRQSSGVHLTSRVLIVDGEPVHYLDLACRRADLAGVFTGLVADICLMLSRDMRDPAGALTVTLGSWRELFGGQRPAWTVPRLAGLYGELVVLEELLVQRPSGGALWVGPTGAPQDFWSDRNAIEVKTTTATHGRVVRIHGLDQLDPPATGFLSVLWCRVSVATSGDGDTVSAAIGRCLKLGGDQPLLSLLDKLRLPPPTTPDLATTSFELVERRVFDVDEDFPRITPDRFHNAVTPAGVGGVEYLVDLDVVTPTDEDLTALVDRFLDAP